jgi:hypothetical protein
MRLSTKQTPTSHLESVLEEKTIQESCTVIGSLILKGQFTKRLVRVLLIAAYLVGILIF